MSVHVCVQKSSAVIADLIVTVEEISSAFSHQNFPLYGTCHEYMTALLECNYVTLI